MIKIKEHLSNIQRVDCSKDLRRDCLRLDMNENPSGLPARFIRKILASIDANFLSAYPEYGKLQEKVAKVNGVKPENICLANGSDAAIKYIFETYIEPGDKVLLTDPSFAMYPIYCRMYGAVSVFVDYASDLSLPFDQLLKSLSENIKMAVVVNPNNPTGSVLTKVQMKILLEQAKRNNVLLVVDEAYFYYYNETVIKEVEDYDNLIVLRTLSKLCGIAALRIGFAASTAAIAQNLRVVRPTYDVNAVAVAFALKILDQPKVIERMIEDVNKGREFLVAKLASQNIVYVNGMGNFVLIDCGLRADQIREKLKLKRILVGGHFNQLFLKSYLRVSLGEPVLMKRFWDAFLPIWENLK